jgi:hypothetical protein
MSRVYNAPSQSRTFPIPVGPGRRTTAGRNRASHSRAPGKTVDVYPYLAACHGIKDRAYEVTQNIRVVACSENVRSTDVARICRHSIEPR